MGQCHKILQDVFLRLYIEKNSAGCWSDGVCQHKYVKESVHADHCVVEVFQVTYCSC